MKRSFVLVVGCVVISVMAVMAQEKAAAPAAGAEPKAGDAGVKPQGICPFTGKTAGGAVAKPQVTCPVQGNKVATNLYVDAEGFRIYVCCPDCLPKVKADPKKYLEVIRKNGETPECRVCPKCGEVKGDAKCCKDAAACASCGLHKDSPGCKMGCSSAAKASGTCPAGGAAAGAGGDKPATCPVKAEKAEKAP